MNPHLAPSTSIVAMIRSFWKNRSLIRQMTWRDVLGRYRGSLLGLAWSFFNPLLMLGVYTFVFSGVFKARWAGNENADAPHAQFALILFVGMVVNSLFADVLNRAPGLVLGNANFVKKVVFPLEILPVIATGAAVFHAVISIFVLLLALLLVNGSLPWTAVCTPLVLAPLIVMALGAAWFLASLGVFVRDVGQTIGILTSIMMFLAPVFYPISALPEPLRPWIMLNPITFVIEQLREVLVWGRLPDWWGWVVYCVVSMAVAWAGFFWFQKTRKGFSDVL
jgi:lipopolysaccharide transport system permease protein